MVYIQRFVPLYRPDVVLIAVCDNDFDANLQRTAYGIAKPMFRVQNGRIAELIPPDPNNIGIKKFQTSSDRLRAAAFRSVPSVSTPTVYPAVQAAVPARESQPRSAIRFYYEPQSTRGAEFPVFEVLIKEADKTVRAAGGIFWFYSHPHLADVGSVYSID